MIRRDRGTQALNALAMLAGCLTLAACDGTLTPPTPPLLDGVSAGGGWWNGGCPTASDANQQGKEDLSPELMARLNKQFPPGTEAAALGAYLAGQGFQPPEPCEGAPTIQRAIFRQQGDGLAYTTFAVVVWKVSDDGDIVWTKGHVAFTGP